jgi:hypothetical protein
MSVPGISDINVYKYKGKCYLMQENPRLMVEIGDISYIFDDKYVALPTAAVDF